MSRDAVRSIAVRLERTPAALRVRYELEADIAGLRIPAPGPVRVGDKLWQHTCFEIFIAERMPAYREFNFSPSREWAMYSFRSYREADERSAKEPAVSVHAEENRLQLDAVVPLESTGRLLIALSAVMESREGALSYWALRHPPGKPDFHHPDAFALELDEIRD